MDMQTISKSGDVSKTWSSDINETKIRMAFSGQTILPKCSAIDAMCKFNAIGQGNGNVALQAFRGQYLCAEGGGGDGVAANRDWVAGWETFKLIPA